ncbi:MAG TPA: class I SAM-dependent methyltransferase [Tepidisphaeraceae bacterium]|nr:class I SAM-dependent methyltransferase [Tepidisphaeraceae bacterium]
MDSTSAINPRTLKVHRVPARDVPYVPTDDAVVAAMLRFAGVTERDVLYDLGCGDGRIVIQAARLCGCRGVGVDIDPVRIMESRENAKRARVTDRVRFYCQSFFDTDFREATVVALYLLPSINVKLRPRLMSDLRTGARIVANGFEIAGWPADMRAEAHHRTLHQWIVPARVDGAWAGVIDAPPVGRSDGRRRIGLRLVREFQTVSGEARVDGRTYPVVGGRLFGERFTFKVMDPQKRRPAWRFSATVEDRGVMRGTCQLAGWDAAPIEWGAIKR